jgi:hypothetical protein
MLAGVAFGKAKRCCRKYGIATVILSGFVQFDLFRENRLVLNYRVAVF